MQAELSSWRPLWDSATILFVLGMASALSSRDRSSWWLSQGLLLVSIVMAFAAAGAVHSGIDLFSLGMWIPIAWAITWLGAVRLRKSSTVKVRHD